MKFYTSILFLTKCHMVQRTINLVQKDFSDSSKEHVIKEHLSNSSNPGTMLKIATILQKLEQTSLLLNE